MKLVALVALMMLVADQTSKIWILHGIQLPDHGQRVIVPQILELRMAWNRGINFGLFGGSSPGFAWLLTTLALGIIAWVLVWLVRTRPGVTGLVFGGLLIGGALGNSADRVVHGAVVDFINLSCCGIDNPYVFNLADTGIVCGALGLFCIPGRARAPSVDGRI